MFWSIKVDIRLTIASLDLWNKLRWKIFKETFANLEPSNTTWQEFSK